MFSPLVKQNHYNTFSQKVANRHFLITGAILAYRLNSGYRARQGHTRKKRLFLKRIRALQGARTSCCAFEARRARNTRKERKVAGGGGFEARKGEKMKEAKRGAQVNGRGKRENNVPTHQQRYQGCTRMNTDSHGFSKRRDTEGAEKRSFISPALPKILFVPSVLGAFQFYR